MYLTTSEARGSGSPVRTEHQPRQKVDLDRALNLNLKYSGAVTIRIY